MKFEISLGRVQYETQGVGRPLFILHGGPGDITFMKGVMEPVFERNSDWQRIYFDLPGNGQTEATHQVDSYDRVLDFVIEFIDSISDGQPYALAGYSYGGYLARGVVHKRRDMVRGLCLIAPRVMQDRTMKTVPDHETLFVEPGFEEHLKDGEDWVADYVVVQTKQGLETFRQYGLPCLKHYDEEFSEMISHAGPGLSFDVDDLSHPFDYPTLIITGRQDSVTGYQDAWSLLEIYPRATYVVVDQAGHFVGLIEQVDLFRSLVGEWLERLANVSFSV